MNQGSIKRRGPISGQEQSVSMSFPLLELGDDLLSFVIGHTLRSGTLELITSVLVRLRRTSRHIKDILGTRGGPGQLECVKGLLLRLSSQNDVICRRLARTTIMRAVCSGAGHRYIDAFVELTRRCRLLGVIGCWLSAQGGRQSCRLRHNGLHPLPPGQIGQLRALQAQLTVVSGTLLDLESIVVHSEGELTQLLGADQFHLAAQLVRSRARREIRVNN